MKQRIALLFLEAGLDEMDGPAVAGGDVVLQGVDTLLGLALLFGEPVQGDFDLTDRGTVRAQTPIAPVEIGLRRSPVSEGGVCSGYV